MTPRKVLVVDDDEELRHLLMEYLRESCSVNVQGARDGVEALHCISTSVCTVVILDVMMPHMSGIDFLDSVEALMSDPSIGSLEQLPAVIVITSAPAEDLRADQLQQRFPALVHSVLRKPLDAGALATRVTALLS